MSRIQPNGVFNARSAAPASQMHYFRPHQDVQMWYLREERERFHEMREEMRRMR